MDPSSQKKKVEADLDAGRTDYGRIHFKTPAAQITPTSTEGLAHTLRECHDRGRPVTVRNTGHSTNGQTLTTNTQISLAGLNGTEFHADERLVVAGAGASWDSVIKAADFPRFAPPIFPNNPGQLIHVGGTASVGGVGYYCSKFGGFWNHVRSLTLVTMRGEIVECSRDQNAELFRYSIAGYGRVGVIAEVGVDVVESKPKVMGIVLGYLDDDKFERDLATALRDPAFHGVAASKDLSGWEAKVLDTIGIDFGMIVALVEADEDIDVDATISGIRAKYHEHLMFFLDASDNGDGTSNLELGLKPRLIDKREVVYFSTSEQSWWKVWGSKIKSFLTGKGFASTLDQHSLCHPWSDCFIQPARHRAFVEAAGDIINANKMARYLEKESFLNGLVDIDSFATFGVKRFWKDEADRLPLSLDLPDVDEFTLGVAIMPNVPPKLLDVGLKTSKEISDLVYEMGGKRYLYGAHDLSVAQVEQHFGRSTIDEWQSIKDEHDPKHLLNIGVVEHLDG